MIYFRYIFLILLAFALHIGLTALTQVGWPLQPLVVLSVLAVWLDRTTIISRVFLPAAFLVDILQPTHVPLVTLAVLSAWFVAAMVQHRWLTNHSLASLFGLSVLGIAAATLTTAVGLWIAASLGASATPLSAAWSTSGVFKQLAIAVVVTFGIGLLLRNTARFFRSRFLYASR